MKDDKHESGLGSERSLDPPCAVPFLVGGEGIVGCSDVAFTLVEEFIVGETGLIVRSGSCFLCSLSL